MPIVWDEAKNQANRAKHGVSFERASAVFEDPFLVSNPDLCEHEERWQTLGLVNGVLILLVVHTLTEQADDEEIRIISARKATRQERQIYEEKRKEYE
jgi:uncharacterized protein